MHISCECRQAQQIYCIHMFEYICGRRLVPLVRLNLVAGLFRTTFTTDSAKITRKVHVLSRGKVASRIQFTPLLFATPLRSDHLQISMLEDIGRRKWSLAPSRQASAPSAGLVVPCFPRVKTRQRAYHEKDYFVHIHGTATRISSQNEHIRRY